MSDANGEQAAADAAADIIFGPEETPEPVETPEELPSGDEMEVEPVVEGDEPEDEAEVVAEETDDDPIVEFEWNGQIIEAPNSIKESLMLQQDYTQKTQAMSAERKTFEVAHGELKQNQEAIQFTESILPDILKARQLEATAEEWHNHLKQNIDSLSSTDIEKIKLAIEGARTERDDLVQSLTVKQQEFQQAREQSFEELLNKGTEVLRSRIPGWSEQTANDVTDYAVSSGFTEAEVARVVDPRQVEVLWKAKQYDDLQAGKTAAVKTVQAAPSIKRKPRNPMSKETGDKLNLRKKLKSPNVSAADKAAAIAKNLERLF